MVLVSEGLVLKKLIFLKISNLIKACSGRISENLASLLRLGILSSASFWRGNQVGGLPRRPTSLAEERILSVSNTPSGKVSL